MMNEFVMTEELFAQAEICAKALDEVNEFTTTKCNVLYQAPLPTAMTGITTMLEILAKINDVPLVKLVEMLNVVVEMELN